ncbi:MAG: hypothetical protein IJ960_03270 [Oscillospiraceae bacterium]|nr:hypothetical protein [Oscillospiraceae bacterium]
MSKWKELFTVPEDRKMTEKDLFRVLFSSVFCIFLCMFGLASTTWALFSYSITSQNNAISIGEFTVSAQLAQDGVPVEPAEGIYTLGPGEYVLTIDNTGTCRGYCQLLLTDTVGESHSFTTATLLVDESIVVPLSVTGGAVEMTLSTNWGESPVQTDEPLAVVITVEPLDPSDLTPAVSDPTEPSEEPSESTPAVSDPTEPSEEPSESTPAVSDPTEPSEEPSESTPAVSDPTEPSEEPTESTPSASDPAQPSEAPAESVPSVTDPAEPTEKATEPVE